MARAIQPQPADVDVTESAEATLTTNNTPVLAATAWRDNSDMIVAAAQLGHLRKDWLTLDATVGKKAVFWKRWRPGQLVTNDFDPEVAADFHHDFRDLPFPSMTFDAVVFDPPYVCVGGRTTTGIPEMHERYGLTEAPKSPEALLEMNMAGLDEMVRLMKPRGILLLKYQDQVSGGKFFPGTHYMAEHAIAVLGCEWVDRLERTQATSRPQPEHRRQLHARRNLSSLLVFKKRK